MKRETVWAEKTGSSKIREGSRGDINSLRWKRLVEKIMFWARSKKSDGVIDRASGGDDELTCAKWIECKEEWSRLGWRNEFWEFIPETGRYYQKERFVILRVEDAVDHYDSKRNRSFFLLPNCMRHLSIFIHGYFFGPGGWLHPAKWYFSASIFHVFHISGAFNLPVSTSSGQTPHIYHRQLHSK